jgi:hypothetical protein
MASGDCARGTIEANYLAAVLAALEAQEASAAVLMLAWGLDDVIMVNTYRPQQMSPPPPPRSFMFSWEFWRKGLSTRRVRVQN